MIRLRKLRARRTVSRRAKQHGQYSGLYDSELRSPCLRGCRRWRLKDNPSYVVFAPDGFAGVKCLEVVQTKFELIRQLLSFECQFDTNTETGKVVNSAMVNG